MSKKNEESIKCCEKAIETHPEEEGLKMVYVTYGNALDGLNKTDRSIEVYDEGLKQFPDFYLLHFNKGITLWSVKKYNDALLCFQMSKLNPKHASSHNAIARVSKINDTRIPALLAYCRFFLSLGFQKSIALPIYPTEQPSKDIKEFLHISLHDCTIFLS